MRSPFLTVDKNARGAWASYYFAIVLLIVLGGCTTGIESAPFGWRSGRAGEIIPTGYKTYTLFLNTSYDTAREYTETKAALDREFNDFGELIGTNNFAVWVYDGGGKDLVEPRDWLLALNSLPKIYANAWFKNALSFDNGPYIAVMNLYPPYVKAQSAQSLVQSAGEDSPLVVILGLRGLKPRSVERFLQQLIVQMREAQPDPNALLGGEREIRFKQSLNSLMSMAENHADSIISSVLVAILGKK